jgi:hypothetical protein
MRQPKDLEWSERVTGRESTILFSPSRLRAVPLLVGASLWDSFFVMLWMGLSRAHAPERAFLFPIAHGLIGLVVTWMALVRTLNTLRITLDAVELRITHAPIPRFSTRLPIQSIDRFEAREVDGAVRASRGVRAVRRHEPPVTLDLGLDGLDEVEFVSDRLNAALAIARGEGEARVTATPTCGTPPG